MEIRENRCVPVELSDHDRYLDLLNQLKEKTAYIMLVQVSGPDSGDPVVEQAESCMRRLERNTVQEWPGTVTLGRGGEQYVYAAAGAFFEYLKQFPSFFFRFQDSWGCCGVSDTGFGYDDIAFLDGEQRLLFYTTTHEGYAYLRE
ncbi:MAG: hypothetical protein HFF39_00475 [Lawsonibacter sp.]|nr:hypothetical protein [Lawsonibacter sp.]